MSRIEKVMAKRSATFKVALAVVALLLVVWIAGTSLANLLLVPVLAIILWVIVHLVLEFRHRGQGV
jgi:hypothetical protein